MNPYVMENTKLKTATENDFKKSFFKVMSTVFLERPWKILGTTETLSYWQTKINLSNMCRNHFRKSYLL